MLAWPSRAALAQAAGEAASGEGLDLVARECLATVLRDFASRWPETGPRVLLTHAMIDGSVTSTGQPLVGCDMNISLSELALANADAIVAGHIHRPQEWCIGETPVLYTGSPYRTAFGELEEKSLIKIVFHERIPTVTRIPLPAQGMLLLENRWLPDVGWEETHEQSPCGCEVRWRYRVDADHRAAARDSALAMKSLLETRGADRVVIEEQVIANARARVSEISSAHTLAQKLDALWSCKGSTPDHVRRAELIRKADQLDQEVRNAL
jgi:DNA repair exonuclease SbcCD nuclease subunit